MWPRRLSFGSQQVLVLGEPADVQIGESSIYTSSHPPPPPFSLSLSLSLSLSPPSRKHTHKHTALPPRPLTHPYHPQNSLFVRFLDKLAAMIKLPSRVTTYIEMFMDSERTAAMHLAPLETATKDDPDVKLVLCEAPDFNCTAPFDFDANSRVVRFAGRPPSVRELLQAMK
mmetsp:Transcript_42572/g.113811  ORF Transcript_42572/g.113811 Transcript_42572/m.113811 type:complete len:171 (+) Transcript_42572:1935-2447(+)